MNKKLVLLGAGDFGEAAFDYFTDDSDYEVAAFAVEPPFAAKASLCGIPVVTLPELPGRFPPDSHDVFVSVTYTQLNRARARLYRAVKEMGYAAASYVSSRAFVSPRAALGENCFVFENNVIQHHAVLGNNVILWSGNHIRHHVRIGDHCFISSHVVIAGYAEIGQSSFLGVNSTVTDSIRVGKDCWIGAAAVISQNTGDSELFHVPCTTPSKVTTHRYFKIRDGS